MNANECRTWFILAQRAGLFSWQHFVADEKEFAVSINRLLKHTYSSLSFFFLFQQIVTHNYLLINMVISHAEMVGRGAVILNRKVTWLHSKRSNSCKHMHTPTQVCVCVWSKYFQGDNMRIYEALYPFNKWPNNPHDLCSTQHLRLQHSMKLTVDYHSKLK